MACRIGKLDYADYEGEHIQHTGKMDLDDYFEQDQRYIKLDLEAYLESKYVVKNVTGYIKNYDFLFQKRKLLQHQ
jgi:hypothetical protein